MWGNDEIQEMTVVTKDWKYIYWQYSDHRMLPTEELFHIGKDRLEMTNLANNPTYNKQLKKMRKLYDKRYKHLVKNTIKTNDYPKYKVLFDRKANAVSKKQYLTGNYEEVLKQQAIEKAKKAHLKN